MPGVCRGYFGVCKGHNSQDASAMSCRAHHVDTIVAGGALCFSKLATTSWNRGTRNLQQGVKTWPAGGVFSPLAVCPAFRACGALCPEPS
jgi:hypothetical protein